MKTLLSALVTSVVILALGCSGGSPTTATTVTTTTIVPPAPAGLTATSGNAQVSLSWAASLGATSYTVYYATTTGVTTGSTNKATSLPATSYTVTNLTNGTPYFFVVTAVNTAGESGVSMQATATPAAPAPSVPTAPAALAGTVGNAQVALSWTPSTGAVTYNLYYSLSSGVTIANGTKIGGITGPNYTQTGLANGSTYYYIVTAVSAAGESAASAETSARPLAPLPGAPAAITATPGNSQVALSWTASTGAITYNLYYGTSAALSTSNGTKVGSLSGTAYTVPGLVNSTVYYFIVTAANGTGESAPSSKVSATPSNGITIALTPGSVSTGTLPATATTSLTYTFPAAAVTASAIATINPLTQASLPIALPPNGTFTGAFALSLNPTSITALNAPVGISGSVGSSVPANQTLVLAMLQNGAWVGVGTFLTGVNGFLNQSLASVALPGLLAPATYLIYQPAAGTNTSVSNLGLALFTDSGNNVQVIHMYDSKGSLLATPTISYLNFSGTNDLNGLAVTPDGSQGIVVGALRIARFFSALQTGVPIASKTTIDLSAYGGNSDAVAMLPNGDEAVVTTGSSNQLVVISGILAGAPVAAINIPVAGAREGLIISNDGKVMLARSSYSLSVYAIAPITPKAGPLGGTISHSYTMVADLPALGSVIDLGDGRVGMAFSPVDSSRAVVIRQYSAGGTVQVMTGLTTANPVAGTSVNLPTGTIPYTVATSPDGKLAIVGAKTGLLLYTGIDTGSPMLVGTSNIGAIQSLGTTLDGKYAVAVDVDYKALVVVPFTAAGFAAPVVAFSLASLPGNDQLIIH